MQQGIWYKLLVHKVNRLAEPEQFIDDLVQHNVNMDDLIKLMQQLLQHDMDKINE